MIFRHYFGFYGYLKLILLSLGEFKKRGFIALYFSLKIAK